MKLFASVKNGYAPFRAMVISTKYMEDAVEFTKPDITSLELILGKDYEGVVLLSGWEKVGGELIDFLKQLDKADKKLLYYCNGEWGDSKLKFIHNIDRIKSKVKGLDIELKITIASVILDDAYKGEYQVILGKYNEKNHVPDGVAGIEKISFNQRIVTVKAEKDSK